ncbi:NAD(P)/FAD-dependent oxidoreductase [Halomonas rhizosphaerae]|uniref:FAD-dependent oxidoreductase n=1 Tax=Halomonas rhizosphaerae TaxID=3043296 RepID=A0ABT6UWD1_9GAMM|nr:FAD-dependent oxidoreductase [Halomonas rhizosphaerae]MDI5889961.1 FAD-dependent oxidoreductase [Halomonas rhizosphaerae]
MYPAPPETEHLVIIGNGMAGHRLVEALLKRPDRPARITVVGDEATAAYNRILLSPWLAGEMEREALILRKAEWYAEQGIELVLGERVTSIDRTARRLTTDAGRALDYQRLVLATGSRPAMPAVPGIELSGVHGFRDLDDAEALAGVAERGGRVVVIGGGLLGLEAAEGLRKRGEAACRQGTGSLAVSVLQRSAQLMNRQLDATAAGLLEAELTRRGLAIHTGAQLAAIEGDHHGRVTGVRLADGKRLAADGVVIATGITPNAELGREAGLATQRAIEVDGHLTTSDSAIHALGECCQFEGTTYGLVEPIWRQVEVLAEQLGANPAEGARYEERPSATRLKIGGISLFAFGPIDPDAGHEVLAYHDPVQGDYRRLLLRDGRLEGAVLYGDTAMGPWLFGQAQAGRDLGPCRRALLLGAADADALLDAHDLDTDFDTQDRPVKEAA